MRDLILFQLLAGGLVSIADFGIHAAVTGLIVVLARHVAGPFEFAFENYTALGYGDAVPNLGYRLMGPITALNGLLLIGWSVAIILDVLKMADVRVARGEKRAR